MAAKQKGAVTVGDLNKAVWEFIEQSPAYKGGSPIEKSIAEMTKPLLGLGLFGLICTRPETDEVTLKEIVESLFQVREVMNKQLNN